MKKLILILIALLLISGTATAATLTVDDSGGQKFKTIQAAVNAASTGDIIYVYAGSYPELVRVNDKILTFQGEKTTCYKYPSVYGFEFGNTPDGLKAGAGNVNGFTINGKGIQFGVIGNCIIRNNLFKNCGVGAGGCSCSNITVMNNKFSGNYNYDGVYLMECYEHSITGNTFYKANNGIVLRWGAACSTITGNTFDSCKVGTYSGYKPSVLLGNKYPNTPIQVKIVEDF